MILDQIYVLLLQMFDSVIDFLPQSPFINLLEWLDWDEYAELISNIMYFVPTDCIVFFVNFCIPVIGLCAVIGSIRLIWDILPFT